MHPDPISMVELYKTSINVVSNLKYSAQKLLKSWRTIRDYFTILKKLRKFQVSAIQNSERKVSQSTTLRWMKLLGFNYSVRHKTYFTDAHEQEEIVQFRNEFATYYIEK